jgi:hypothetical protein
VRIAIVTARAGAHHPIDHDLEHALRGWGCHVTQVSPWHSTRSRPWPHDVTVVRSTAGAELALARRLHHQGAVLINPYPTLLATSTRAVAARRLIRAGLAFGPRRSASRTRRWRLALVGDTVFLAPGPTGAAPPAPSLADAGLRDLVASAAAALDTRLLGIEVEDSGHQPTVVAVSAVPDLTGLPEAGLRLAEYVYAAARSAVPAATLAGPASTLAGPAATWAGPPATLAGPASTLAGPAA